MLRIVSVGRRRLPPVSGTPIEKTDANTRAVFGDYISIYDIQRAVADKATVPIYYESRISKLSLNAAELPKLDAEFEEITEGEELTKKEKLKTKWAALETNFVVAAAEDFFGAMTANVRSLS